jgi:phage baseplate assembly protein W
MATVDSNISRTYKDLDLFFNVHPVKKDVNKHVGEYAVINSVKNLVSTNHYEKPFQPDIGSNIQKLLFEPLDIITAAGIEREIESVIGSYEPRARIKTVNLVPDYDNNGYKVELEFFIVNRTEPISINFFLERVR